MKETMSEVIFSSKTHFPEYTKTQKLRVLAQPTHRIILTAE